VLRLTPLDQAEPEAVERLLDAAFGPDRHGRTAYRLRAGVAPIAGLSFAAFRGKALVGTIQCWPVALTSETIEPLVLVGPVAVHPDHQQAGIGRMLMHAALDAADRAMETALVLIGDPEYYGRFFGFDAAATAGWSLPGPYEPRRLLVRLDKGRTLPRHGLLSARSDLTAPSASLAL
jgi:predicted N-acetyltransferase YhbS